MFACCPSRSTRQLTLGSQVARQTYWRIGFLFERVAMPDDYFQDVSQKANASNGFCVSPQPQRIPSSNTSQICSGRAFSLWDIAVCAAVENSVKEDLNSNSAVSTSKRFPSCQPYEKAGSKLRRAAARMAQQVGQHVELLPLDAGPTTSRTSAHPSNRRLGPTTSTGWIRVRNDGQSTQEKGAGVRDTGWMPSHYLPDFFGPATTFKSFKLVKYLGQKARPVIDRAGKVYALFGKHPADPKWIHIGKPVLMWPLGY
ncbi:hypothetical protein B0H13DRAFT_1862094 [Mycena leptocephala]|nr:hypothetical protein B0H13DRAFT_1862094 [Mycena leptocephala]